MILFVHAREEIRFIVIGDRTNSAVENIFEEIIGEIDLLSPDFVINVGDIVEGYTADTLRMHAQWDSVLATVGTLSCPFYFTPGNHDIQNENDRNIFINRTGHKRYYSFDYDKNHLIVLDNSMMYWSQPQEMDEEQIKWLRDDLENNKDAENIFVFFHIPTFLYALQDETADPLMDLFEKYRVRFVFAGHHHEYSYCLHNNVEYINIGSSGGSMGTGDFVRGHFYHYLMVTVREGHCDIAVIKKGSVFLRSVVTADDLVAIDRADNEAIRINPFIIQDNDKEISEGTIIEISNFGPDTLSHTLTWSFDSSRYAVDPPEQTMHIAPDERAEYPLELTIHNGSEIFPLPRYTLVYPFSHGKVCTLMNLLPVKRLKKVERITAAPVLDGVLDDEIWGRMDPIADLATYDGLPDPPVERTEVYFCHDRENVYLAARCFESDFGQLVAEETEPDGRSPWDDNLWLFFDTDYDQETYYQAIINSNGAVFDRECSVKEGDSYRNITWNGPWEIAAGREKNAWILEIRIPKKELKFLDEKMWGFNFRRLQPRTGLGDAGYWSVPFGHDPGNFGILQFE